MRSGVIKSTLAALIAMSAVARVQAQTTMPNPTPPTQPPATAAASAPVIPVDTSTPRGALKTLLTAMQSGDAEGIKKVIYAASPTEEQLIDAMAHRVIAESKFKSAATKAFGADEAKGLVGDGEASLAANLAQFDTAAETIEADSAIVTNKDGVGEPVRLKKIGGKWQIPASEFSKSGNDTQVQQNINDLNFTAGLIDQFAQDVSAGKYKTAPEAKESIQLQMRAALEKYAMSRGAATTPGATTGPSSGPG